MKKKMFLILVVCLLLSQVVAAQVDLSLASQDPNPVKGGDVVKVKFKVENRWRTTRNDIILEIDPVYPFSLYEDDAKKNVGTILGRSLEGDAVLVDFKLRVDPEAKDGENAIDVALRTEGGEIEYDDEFFIDVESEKIKLVPYVRESNLITHGKGLVTLEVANAGGYDVKYLELQLLDSKDYKLLSTSDYVYIGNLESDDTESQDFEIFIAEGKDAIKVPLMLKYEANERDYEETFDLSLNLLSKEEAKAVGLTKKSYTPIYVLVVALIIFGFAVWRKRRKK